MGQLEEQYIGLARIKEKLKAKNHKRAVRCIERDMAKVKAKIYNRDNVYSLIECEFNIKELDV